MQIILDNYAEQFPTIPEVFIQFTWGSRSRRGATKLWTFPEVENATVQRRWSMLYRCSGVWRRRINGTTCDGRAIGGLLYSCELVIRSQQGAIHFVRTKLRGKLNAVDVVVLSLYCHCCSVLRGRGGTQRLAYPDVTSSNSGYCIMLICGPSINLQLRWTTY